MRFMILVPTYICLFLGKADWLFRKLFKRQRQDKTQPYEPATIQKQSAQKGDSAYATFCNSASDAALISSAKHELNR